MGRKAHDGLAVALLEDAYKIEMLAFEAAKSAAETAIAAYNASLEHYKTRVEGYRIYASVYESVMKGELAKVEAFKALLQAEETKGSCLPRGWSGMAEKPGCRALLQKSKPRRVSHPP